MGAKELATGPVERGVLNQPGQRFVPAGRALLPTGPAL